MSDGINQNLGETTERAMEPGEFIDKWRGVETTESAAAQQHFIDLCRELEDAQLVRCVGRFFASDGEMVRHEKST